MAFFQDLGKKITDAAQDASKKTNEMIEVSKLNGQINKEKAAITETEKKIGSLVYDMYVAGEPLPESLLAEVQLIAEKNRLIQDTENKIVEIKAEAERQKAEKAEHHAQAEPAQADPVQQPAQQPVAEAAPASRFCTSCGAPLEEGMLFCGKCGTKNEP